MISKDKRFKAEWVNLGEGLSGDYNVEDPEDINLLRFDCFVKEGKFWVDPGDASYCTRMPVNTPKATLKLALQIILDRFADTYDAHTYKRALEELSWICPEDFS